MRPDVFCRRDVVMLPMYFDCVQSKSNIKLAKADKLHVIWSEMEICRTCSRTLAMFQLSLELFVELVINY